MGFLAKGRKTASHYWLHRERLSTWLEGFLVARQFVTFSGSTVTIHGSNASISGARECRKDYARMQLHRGIMQIHFDYEDRVWKELWKRVDRAPKDTVVPVLTEFMAETKLQKRHIVQLILKLRIHGRLWQGSQVSQWLFNGSPFETDDSDLILRIEMVGRVSKFAAKTYFMDLPPDKRTEAAYSTYLKVLARWHAIAEAEAIMKEMKTLNLLRSVEPYNVMMNMYRRKNKEEQVRAIYGELEASGIAPDIQTYLIVLRSRKLIGGFDGIEEKTREYLKKQMEHPKHPIFVFESMIRAYALLGDLTAMERIWSILNRASRISTSSYLCMIDSYGLLSEVEKAESVFKEMESTYVLLSRHYRAMIAVYAEHGVMDKANELYKRIFKAGHNLSPAIYHDMVSGYMKIKDFENALVTFEKARDRAELGNPKPLRSTVLLVMKVHAENGDFQAAEKLMYEVRNEPLYSGTAMYNLLLHAYIKAEIPVRGFEKRMMTALVEPDDETRRLLARIEMPEVERRRKSSKHKHLEI